MLPFNIDVTGVKTVYDNKHNYLNIFSRFCFWI